MPATFVLRGVRSPRTYASSVTCSTRPPSQPFQFQVIVTRITAASSTTNTGTTNVRHFALGGTCACSGSGALEEAGVLAVAILDTPPVFALHSSFRAAQCFNLLGKKHFAAGRIPSSSRVGASILTLARMLSG